MNKVYLLLGSNLSDPWKQLDTARHKISKIASIVMHSGIYRTAAWGKTDQPDFLNQVILITTDMTPEATLQSLLEIEQDMGRARSEKNAPRLIDIDILFYNSIGLKLPHLTIPHPHIADRRFVLVPLNEISPDLMHPVLQQTMQQLLEKCTDTLEVKRY
jgi:2-amino-4-hydroxy-6-hydroxymethyldihydropteridine diphosphokinase